MYVCMYVYTCVCVYIYAYTCIYIHTYIHTHVYVQVDQRRSAALRKTSCLIATSLEEGLAAVAAASAAVAAASAAGLRPDLKS